jgi:hypothetical protein
MTWYLVRHRIITSPSSPMGHVLETAVLTIFPLYSCPVSEFRCSKVTLGKFSIFTKFESNRMPWYNSAEFRMKE